MLEDHSQPCCIDCDGTWCDSCLVHHGKAPCPVQVQVDAHYSWLEKEKTMRTTRTYAILDVSRAAYDEIRAKLDAAGYQHAFIDQPDGEGERIDMHGIALRADPEPWTYKSDSSPDPIGVPCPVCDAQIGVQCRGRGRYAPHSDRERVARA